MADSTVFNPLDMTPVDATLPQEVPNTYGNNANPNPNDWRWKGPKLLQDKYMDGTNQYMNDLRQQMQGGAQNNPWMRYQMQQEQERQTRDMNQLQNTGQSNIASQQQNMSMRGGMLGGSQARMERQNLMGQLMGKQDLREGAALRESGIRSEGEDRYNALSGQMNQLEMNKARFDAERDMWNADQINKDRAAKYASEAAMRNS